MSSEKFKNQFRIPSARAAWHNYDGGQYFVTICTAHREYFFGNIVDGEMRLSMIGKETEQIIRETPKHTAYVEIPLFVIMPNHIHLMVMIDENKIPYFRREVACNISTTTNKMQDITHLQGWLSVVIGGIKSAVTKFANQNKIDFAWQARFHDRVIRDTKELNAIANYIENNVSNWANDELK